jgi:hypothetical protein
MVHEMKSFSKIDYDTDNGDALISGADREGGPLAMGDPKNFVDA